MRRWSTSVLIASFALLCCACSEDADLPTDPGSGGGGGSGGNVPAPPDVGPQPSACAPGELPLDGGCLPAGVEVCGDGFDSDGDGGCLPILPAGTCTPPQMALLGDTSCADLVACGAPPWGNIPVDSTTQYVDISYGGNDSDGSATKPWVTIQDAIAAASADAVIAIAAGSYAEVAHTTDKAIKLWGVCPAQVEIAGSGNSDVVQFVRSDGSEVHGVALTGGRFGVSVWDSDAVLVEGVWIHDTGEDGILVSNFGGMASATVRRTLIVGSVGQGVNVEGADVVIEDSTVADVQPNGVGNFGRAIEVDADADLMLRGALSLRRSILERNHDIQLAGWGSDVVIEDSLIRDGVPRVSDDGEGSGIDLRSDSATGFHPSLELRRSVVSDNVSCGVCPFDGDAVIENSVVRATAPRVADGLNGMGILFLPLERDPNLSTPQLTISRSLFADNTFLGIGVSGAHADVEATIVRDTHDQQATIVGGRGIDFEANTQYARRADGSVRGVVVERNVAYGIVAVGSDLLIENAEVSDTLPRPEGSAGRGVGAELDPITGELGAVELYHSLLERNSEYGAGAIGGTLHIENTVVRDTVPSPVGGGWGVVAQTEVESGADSHVDVVRCLIEGNHEANVLVGAATMTLSDSIVRGALPQPASQLFGDGIVVTRFERDENGITKYKDASLELTRSIVADNARAGILNYGASVELSSTYFSCNPLDIDGEVEFTFVDSGDNVCVCDDVLLECKVLSTGLEPPDPVGP